MAIDHQQVMQHSVLKLTELTKQRRKLDKEIARLQKMVRWSALQLSQSRPRPAKSPDLPLTGIGHFGLTDSVRQVLRTYRIWLSPVFIRDLLPTVGFDVGPYREPLPSIHVTLKRLASSREVIQAKLSPGGSVYMWAETGEKSREAIPADAGPTASCFAAEH